jgi:CheY-like chemotaxis protein
MPVKHLNVFDKTSNSHRPEASAPGKPHNLQSCFRAAGLPHTVTVSPALAVRYGWADSSPSGVDRHEVAWLVRLALTGHWPHRLRKTGHGPVLLLEFPAFNGANEAINVRLGILVGENQKIHLVDPEELDEPRPKRACVLAAEDDLDLARLICTMLERGGFAVIHAADGSSAWQLVQNQPFDIVVLDIDMPGLTGIEVCQRIKATLRLAHLPVLLCSGRGDLAEVAKQAGADDFLEKPAGLLQLVSRLEKLLAPNGLRP